MKKGAGSLIALRSKKQTTILRSSSQAKYRAIASLTCEVQWLFYLLCDIQIPIPTPTQVYYDNRSAIHIAHNLISYERTKHIEIDCHVVREKIQVDLIHLMSITSFAQLADIFTKGLH
ncbi:Copia protein, partial [Mucuna pruriens]